MILLLLASNNNVVDICGDVPPQLISQYLLDHSVKSASGIAEALWHSHVAICPEGGGKTGFLFVCLVHEYLVVT